MAALLCCIWVLHKNDVDPWPSECHAHNYQSSEVIDLETGEVFNRHGQLERTLKSKNLKELREKFGLEDQEESQ